MDHGRVLCQFSLPPGSGDRQRSSLRRKSESSYHIGPATSLVDTTIRGSRPISSPSEAKPHNRSYGSRRPDRGKANDGGTTNVEYLAPERRHLEAPRLRLPTHEGSIHELLEGRGGQLRSRGMRPLETLSRKVEGEASLYCMAQESRLNLQNVANPLTKLQLGADLSG
ncbi:hypothetical protein CPAR01_15489 [Colletotrichum paranaense]|uniref:Uncharacterized protein n=1 Tax=Colletotrichum paranaense TaxID=1914294 RepID=A0ABQ9S0P0_9PEZI|nr:uncharacterized protein CPAR01_15489 [Colletotrichum paranaense]KAK1519996.1 hypothetical protein CPAR01_15489 [Colletotrichum paranaense]